MSNKNQKNNKNNNSNNKSTNNTSNNNTNTNNTSSNNNSNNTNNNSNNNSTNKNTNNNSTNNTNNNSSNTINTNNTSNNSANKNNTNNDNTKNNITNTNNDNKNNDNKNNDNKNNDNKNKINLIINIDKINQNNFNKEEDDDLDDDDLDDDICNDHCDSNCDDDHDDDDDKNFISSLLFFIIPDKDIQQNNNNDKNNNNTDNNNNNNDKNNIKNDNKDYNFDNNLDDFGFFDNPFGTKKTNQNKKRLIYTPLLSSRNKKIKTPEDEFKEYFKEADILLPINKEIKNIKDLIELGKTYDPNDKNRYVINLRALNKCVSSLEDLDAMIGMKNIKEMIVDLIFFRLQNINDDTDDMWHLVIQGNPGSGKTEVAKILAKIYYGLGIVKKDKITFAKRSDLIGKYLGHTAKMTQEVFDKSKGGVLFIDEAYSLGNPEGRDSFSKECIDTINQNLTETRDTVVFIAGYKEQLNESFFSYNPGLNRRFKMRLTVDKYNAAELRQIFLKKIKDNKWSILNDDIEKEINKSFFEKNMEMFKYNGGDMENLWHLTKIVHARRIFGKSNDLVKKIILTDLENGFKLYCDNEEVKNRKDDIAKYIQNTMYI